MHFLLLRFSSLGDVVIQTATAAWIKMKYPQSIITFVTSKEFVDLVDENSCIDHVVAYHRQKGFKDLWALRKITRKIHQNKPIDFIIDLHGTTRSFFLKFLSPDIPCLNLDKRRFEMTLLVYLKLDLLKNQKSLHERTINDYQGLFNTQYQKDELENFIQKKNNIKGTLTYAALSGVAENAQDTNFVKPFEKYIVISPVASFSPKRWPVENFKKLTQKFLQDQRLSDYAVVLVAGPGDDYVDIFDELELTYCERFKNLKGKTNLAQSSQVIRQSEFLISNDTGMGHIAESWGVDILSIFGPTSESFGFRPHRKNSQSLSVNLWCRPCSTTGKKKCFRKKQFCMEGVTIESVYNKLTQKLLG